MWIRNTDGRKDAVLTFAAMGFFVVILKVLLAGVVYPWAGKVITFGTIDAATIAAILTPTLGAYVSRRYTDKKFPDKLPEVLEKSK